MSQNKIRNWSDYYRPQTKLREGNVFTGVCDSVYRRRCLFRGGACSGVPAPGGVPARGGCLLWGGLLQGGLPGGLLWGGLLPGGCLLPGGGVWSGGVPGGDPPTAAAAGGAHPTGMHSQLI